MSQKSLTGAVPAGSLAQIDYDRIHANNKHEVGFLEQPTFPAGPFLGRRANDGPVDSRIEALVTEPIARHCSC